MTDAEAALLRELVLACNEARSAERAAYGLVSGRRITGRRLAHTRRAAAWFAARHWIEAQARAALWEAGHDDVSPEVPHAAE